MITRLVYSSKKAIKFSKIDIHELMFHARIFNSNHDITGLLLFDGTYFVQFLEGSNEDISLLYEKIEEDTRHKEVTLIFKELFPERIFDDWSMIYKNISSEFPVQNLKKVHSLRQGKEELLEAILDSIFANHL